MRRWYLLVDGVEMLFQIGVGGEGFVAKLADKVALLLVHNPHVAQQHALLEKAQPAMRACVGFLFGVNCFCVTN